MCLRASYRISTVTLSATQSSLRRRNLPETSCCPQIHPAAAFLGARYRKKIAPNDRVLARNRVYSSLGIQGVRLGLTRFTHGFPESNAGHPHEEGISVMGLSSIRSAHKTLRREFRRSLGSGAAVPLVVTSTYILDLSSKTRITRSTTDEQVDGKPRRRHRSSQIHVHRADGQVAGICARRRRDRLTH